MKKGIRFTDDPAFGGKPRELTAEDYVYSYKRWMDPNGRRGGSPIITDLLIGARPVVDAARSRASSTTTSRSRACARSTATRCNSGSTR